MNPYQKYQQQYQEQMVNTMTQGEMLIMLYDGAIKQVDIARSCIASGQAEEMDVALEKAEKIVRYLRSILDFRFPVSSNLSKLYDFFNTQMVMASIKKDMIPLDEIRPLLVDLRDTFDQCTKIERNMRNGVAMGSVV